MPNGIQTGNKLDVSEAQLFQSFVSPFRSRGTAARDNTEGVVVNAVLLQQYFCGKDLFPGTASGGIDPVYFVGIPEAIQRETNQKMIFRQKLRPFIIDQQTVGLDRVGDPGMVDVIFLLQLDCLSEKRKPR